MKRLLSFTAVALSAVLVLASCTPADDPDDTGTATTTTTTTAAPGETDDGTDDGTVDETDETDEATEAPIGEQVNITLIQSKTEIQSDLEAVIQDFNAKHPDINIELLGTSGDNFGTTLMAQFAADAANAPTIFTAGGAGDAQFEPFMAALDDTEASALLTGALLDLHTNEDGEVNGLPMAVEGYGFIYNVEMFNDAGIDAATLTDMNSFVAALETLSEVDGVTEPIGFSQEDYFIFMHFFNWGIALEEDWEAELEAVGAGEQTLSDIPSVAAWAESLDAITPYSNRGQASYDEQVAGFGVGFHAMIHQGVWAQQVLDQNEVEFEYDFMPYPLEGNQNIPVGPATSWRVNSEAPEADQEAAKTFLDWLITTDDGQTWSADVLNMIPPYEGAMAPEGNLTGRIAEFSADGRVLPWTFTVYPPGIATDGASLMERYYLDEIDSTQLLEELSAIYTNLSGN